MENTQKEQKWALGTLSIFVLMLIVSGISDFINSANKIYYGTLTIDQRALVALAIFKYSNFEAVSNDPNFKDKIEYIVVNEPPPTLLKINSDDSEGARAEKLILNGMKRDYFQREKLQKGFENVLDFAISYEEDKMDRSSAGRFSSKLIAMEWAEIWTKIKSKKKMKEWCRCLYYGAKKEFSSKNGPFLKIY